MNCICGDKSKRKCVSHESRVFIVEYSSLGCQKKSVVYETECRHVAVQRDKQDQKIVYSTETLRATFYLIRSKLGSQCNVFQVCRVVVTGW